MNFVDDDMLIPIMEPKVFIGRNLTEQEGRFYFQDIGTYRRGVRFEAATDEDEAFFDNRNRETYF